MYHQMVLVNFFISSNVVLLKQKSLQQTSKAYIFSWSWRGKMVSAAVLLIQLPLYAQREPKVAALQLHLHSFVRIPVTKKSLTYNHTCTLTKPPKSSH